MKSLEKISSATSQFIAPLRERFGETSQQKAEKAWLLADPLLAVVGKSFEEPGVLWKTAPDVAEELGVDVDLVDYSVDQLGNRLGLIYCSYYPEGEEDRYTTRRQFDKMVPLWKQAIAAVAMTRY